MMTKFFSDCVMVHVLSNKTNIVVYIDKKKHIGKDSTNIKSLNIISLLKFFFWAVNVLQKLA